MEKERSNWFVSRPKEIINSKNDKVKKGAWKYYRGAEPDEYNGIQRLEEEKIWDPKVGKYNPRIYEHQNY